MWTIQHAIDVNWEGVGGRIHVIELKKLGGEWDTLEHKDVDMEEHRQQIGLLEAALVKAMLPPEAAPAPPVPAPPPNKS